VTDITDPAHPVSVGSLICQQQTEEYERKLEKKEKIVQEMQKKAILIKQERQRFYAAQKALAGNYVVVDSRQDFLQIKSVTIKQQQFGPIFIFHRKNSDSFQLPVLTQHCLWNHQDNSKDEFFDCNGKLVDGRKIGGVLGFFLDEHIDPDGSLVPAVYYKGPIFSIHFSAINKPFLIVNSQKLPQYSPMEIKPGEYTMSLSIGSFNPKWSTRATSMIRPTVNGPAQYALKRIALDKSERSGVEQ